MHARDLLLVSSTLFVLPQIAQAGPPQAAQPATPAAASAAPAPAAGNSTAQPAAKPTQPAPSTTPARVPPAAAAATSLHAAEDKLSSEDPQVVRQGIEALVQVGGEPAASAVAARLRRGLPPALIEHAIDALERLGKPSVGPVLIELTLHRRPQVRKSAVEALGTLQIRTAQSVLLYALDDPSTDVRAAAVAALAVVGGARALPALFTATDRGVDGALLAVGKIAGARDVKTIMQRVKDGDVTEVKPALQVMLERQNFPLEGKLAIVREVGQVGSAGARNHLVQWLDAWKQSGNPRLRQALFDAIKHIDAAESQQAKAAAAKPAAAPAAVAAKPAAAPAAVAAKPAAAPAVAAAPAKPAASSAAPAVPKRAAPQPAARDASPPAQRKAVATKPEAKVADARMPGDKP